MTAPAAVLDHARKFLGYTEGPRNNETPFGKWAGAQYEPWCHSFTSYVLAAENLGIGKITYCPAGVVYWRDAGRLFSAPQVGDEFYLWFPSLGRYAHTGFVAGVDGDWIVTIEGNSNRAGSRTGGSVVTLRRKWKGTRTVFGRPLYTPDAPAPAPRPQEDDVFDYRIVTIPAPRADGAQVVATASDGKTPLGTWHNDVTATLKANDNGTPVRATVQVCSYGDALLLSFIGLDGKAAPQGNVGVVLGHPAR